MNIAKTVRKIYRLYFVIEATIFVDVSVFAWHYNVNITNARYCYDNVFTLDDDDLLATICSEEVCF